jgi:hypothetical protein
VPKRGKVNRALRRADCGTGQTGAARSDSKLGRLGGQSYGFASEAPRVELPLPVSPLLRALVA